MKLNKNAFSSANPSILLSHIYRVIMLKINADPTARVFVLFPPIDLQNPSTLLVETELTSRISVRSSRHLRAQPPLLHRRPGIHPSATRNFLVSLRRRSICKDASRPKIRRASQRAKNVPHVILRLHPLFELGPPLPQDALHNRGPRYIYVLNRRLERALIGIEQVIQHGFARVGPVEIRGCAHDDYAGEIDERGFCCTDHGLECGVVFLRCHAVHAAAVGEELGCVLEGFAEEGAGEIHVRGCDVTGDDTGGFGGGGIDGGPVVGIMGPVCLCRRGVVEACTFGKADGEIAECLVDLEDFSAVDTGGVLVWGKRALRDVAGREIGGDFAGVELVLKRNLDGVFGESHVGCGPVLGVYPCNASDEEISLLEVEEGGEDEGADGGGGVYLGFAGGELAD